ncbi:transcription factor bHLH25-like [Curcuma longa]|uniref:transcription factor bHLH25-like n=1 Tax=Curcuma longa TaxID=136217 RepID=UPI003D9DD596
MEETMASPCFSDMGVDQGFFNRWDLQELEVVLEQGSERSPSSESHTERPKKQLKTRSWSSCTTAADQNSALAPRILSFGKPDSPVCHSGFYGGVVKKKVEEVAEGSVSNGSGRSFPAKRTSAHNHEHVMAERKRREKLSQRFIELSAIVPGLKKMDKASVLSDAIKYLKQLQDKVMNLEDQLAKRSIESAVLVRKNQLCVEDDDDDGDFKDDRRRRSGYLPPNIEARVCDKSILIKIHCENRKGVLVLALSEIEKLHLSVVNTSVIPFPGNSLDITIASQIEEAFSMSARDVVKRLNSAFRQFK